MYKNEKTQIINLKNKKMNFNIDNPSIEIQRKSSRNDNEM